VPVKSRSEAIVWARERGVFGHSGSRHGAEKTASHSLNPESSSLLSVPANALVQLVQMVLLPSHRITHSGHQPGRLTPSGIHLTMMMRR
jgi:hypothetical protein